LINLDTQAHQKLYGRAKRGDLQN